MIIYNFFLPNNIMSSMIINEKTWTFISISIFSSQKLRKRGDNGLQIKLPPKLINSFSPFTWTLCCAILNLDWVLQIFTLFSLIIIISILGFFVYHNWGREVDLYYIESILLKSAITLSTNLFLFNPLERNTLWKRN